MSLLHKWLAALRGGEYPQIRYYLRTPKGYCVEGVLCDVWGKGAWVNNNGTYSWVGSEESSNNYLYLPVQLIEDLRKEGVVTNVPLSWLSPEVQSQEKSDSFPGDGSVSIQRLNDRGLGFTRLADLLERLNPPQKEKV